MSNYIDLLRQHIKTKGYKHWRVTGTRWQVPGGVTAYKTSERTNVQYTLRGDALSVSFAIDALEAGGMS